MKPGQEFIRARSGHRHDFSVVNFVLGLSLLTAICPAPTLARDLPNGSKVRCELVLATATAVTSNSKSALRWFQFQSKMVIHASQCVQGKHAFQGEKLCFQLVPDGYSCQGRDIEVYRSSGRGRKTTYRREVLNLTYHSWDKDALVFSAYVGGWPEGSTESEISLGGGASGRATRVGGSWKVVLDSPPEEAVDNTDTVPAPLPKLDAGVLVESKRD